MKRHIRGLLLAGNILSLIIAFWWAGSFIFIAFVYVLWGGQPLNETYVKIGFLFMGEYPFAIVGIVSACIRIQRFRHWPSIVSTIFAIVLFVFHGISLFTETMLNEFTNYFIPYMVVIGMTVTLLILGMVKAIDEKKKALTTTIPNTQNR